MPAADRLTKLIRQLRDAERAIPAEVDRLIGEGWMMSELARAVGMAPREFRALVARGRKT